MRRAGRIFAFALLLTTIGCDRITKQIAMTQLAGKAGKSYFADTLRLEYAENTGAFLSLGAGLPDPIRTLFLSIAAGAGLLVVAIAAFKLRWGGSRLTGALLVLGGGASNLVDRVARGSVVDFMNVGIGSLRTGIFNVADLALIAGMAIVLGIREK
jgi:signal peptidase II